MDKISTPKWDFSLIREKDVYEPSEDTFLLLDAIEKDINDLKTSAPKIILEIGCGSGIVISAIASIFKTDAFCVAVDVNRNACEVTKSTAELNNVQIDILNTDLLNCIRCREIVDVIIFNPPYVSTEQDEVQRTGIAQAWAGGENGREILDRLLPSISELLSVGGVFYLVAISYNDVENIINSLKAFNLTGSVLMSRQILGELLFILKFVKING